MPSVCYLPLPGRAPATVSVGVVDQVGTLAVDILPQIGHGSAQAPGRNRGLLVGGLDGHEAHGRACHRFADRLRVENPKGDRVKLSMTGKFLKYNQG